MSANYLTESTEELKAKYLEIAQTKGFQVAIHELHHQLWQIEQSCFDTPNGFDPEVWKVLNEMRIFSRELWDKNLAT